MLYQFKINGISNSGKPKVDFYCAHCGLIDLYMDGYLYAAKLSTNPREDVEAACKEFLDRINCGDINLFINPKTAVKLKRELCLCDPNVVALEHVRGVKRAQAILRAGLEKSGR